MSLLRAASSYNALPILIYLHRFNEQYIGYHQIEMQKVLNSKPTAGHSRNMNNVLSVFIKQVQDSLVCSESDIELLQVTTKFIKCLDDELTLLKAEARRLFFNDVYLLSEITRLDKLIERTGSEVQDLETEKNYWGVMFRVRNIPVFKDSTENISFFPDEDEILMDPATPKLEPIYKVCQDFLKRSNYELAVTFAKQKLEEIFKETKKEDIECSSIYAIIGLIYCQKGDYRLAAENFHSCLDIREKLFSKDCKEVATPHYNEALMQLKMRKLKEANAMIKLTLPLIEKYYPDHKNLAYGYQMTGKIFDTSGNSSACAPYYAKTLATLEKLNMNNSEYYMYVIGKLSQVYVKLKQDENVDSLLTRYSKVIDTLIAKEAEVVHKGETLYIHLKKKAGDIDGDKLQNLYGSIDKYDVANFMETLHVYFKKFGSGN